VQSSFGDAIKDIKDGATIMIGGYGECGLPHHLLKALGESGKKNLTVISASTGK